MKRQKKREERINEQIKKHNNIQKMHCFDEKHCEKY